MSAGVVTTHRGTEAPANDIPFDVRDALTSFGDRLGIFGRHLHWYAQTASTNDVALRLAENGAPEGTVVGADAQTAGRGRLGRTWASPAGSGLYVSTVLRPASHALPLLTIAAGVAISDGIHAASGLRATLKWPNDLYLGPRKVAGILAESGASPAETNHVVLGFGINLLPAAYPADVAARATSLESELGRPVDRGVTLASCLTALAERYERLRRGDAASVLAAWRAGAAATINRRVACVAAAGTISGVVQGIDDSGALLVRTDDAIVRVISGEVVWS